MKRIFPFYVFALPLITLFVLTGSHSKTVHVQDVPTPTPTYDPLTEPYVPENPSEYELGHNWYWLNCMPCHGDVGQGLTDEFRAIWPEDHQNCWAYGCHGDRRDEEGFSIPTVVPPLVNESKLGQFSSQQAFYEYLKFTHPPQDPGCLDDEQYEAITKYVFSMNDRPLENPTPVPTITPTLSFTFSITSTSTPNTVTPMGPSQRLNGMIYIGLGILVVAIVIWGFRAVRMSYKSVD